MMEAEKVSLEMEQKWVDDPNQTRAKFTMSMKGLQTFTAEDWFKFKNQRNPPLFTKKIMDAVCYLLWCQHRILVLYYLQVRYRLHHPLHFLLQ
jgi:hypothetical protein